MPVIHVRSANKNTGQKAKRKKNEWNLSFTRVPEEDNGETERRKKTMEIHIKRQLSSKYLKKKMNDGEKCINEIWWTARPLFGCWMLEIEIVLVRQILVAVAHQRHR